MGGIFFALIIALAFFGFAIYGFIAFLAFLFSPREPDLQKKPVAAGLRRNIYQDAVAAAHLLNRLIENEEITAQSYCQARDFLDLKYGNIIKLPRRIRTGSEFATVDQNAAVPKTGSEEITSPTFVPKTPHDIVSAEAITSATATTLATETSRAVNDADIPLAPIATPQNLSPQPAQPAAENIVAQNLAAQPVSVRNQTATRPPQRPAPWDMPDPPAPPERRSMGELMGAFMQDKNIRWGELASGILIVGSAVGLVVSLRNQLNDTIPYFSALMFMLITAAIHGAGNYTLHKWKLRNTSRGALVIGLLLIPINLLAACILTGGETRRSLDDPMLWIAIVVGLAAFGLMSWYSSRSLLRRGYLPVVASIMGAAIGTLLINRLSNESSVRTVLLCLPVVAGFVAGTMLFTGRFQNRKWLTTRGSNRLLTLLGISTFAALSAVVLAVVRFVPGVFEGSVSIMPAISVICLGAIRVGMIIQKGNTIADETITAIDNPITPHPINSTIDSAAEIKRTMQVVGLALQILGAIMSAVSLGLSVANPSVLMINSAVLAVGFLLIAIKSAQYRILPAAWLSLAFTLLSGMHLATGRFGFDTFASLEELVQAVVSGQSGLCLLGAGALIAGLQTAVSHQIADPGEAQSARRFGMPSAAGVFGLGCLLALMASLLNPFNVFDTMTATALTGVAAISGLVVAVRKRELIWLPLVSSALLLVFLAHAFLWDPTIGSAVAEHIGTGFGSLVLIATLHSIVMAIAAYAFRQFTGNDSPGNSIQNVETASAPVTTPASFAVPATISAALASLGAFAILDLAPAVPTALSAIATVAAGLIAVATRPHNNQSPATDAASRLHLDEQAGWFKFSTALTLSVSLAAFAPQFGWPLFTEPTHWLIQISALSIWSILWSLAAAAFNSRNRNSSTTLAWIVNEPARADRQVSRVCAAALAGLTAIGLSFGVGAELLPTFEYSFSLQEMLPWLVTAVAAVFLAHVVALVERPRFVDGFWIVVTWMVAWAAGSVCFESSVSIGSALRWLLPLGGLAGAILIASRRPLIPAWVASRNRLSLSGASTWRGGQSQKLINVWLAIVVSTVITITTLTTWRVMVHGGYSLGGPVRPSLFGNLMIEISYGVPIAIVVGTFLLYAISERRKWLATAGSMVFQYFVILAVVLLFVSPHPAMATERFLKILQVVSLGMTIYGFVWFWFRERIEPTRDALLHGSVGRFVKRLPAQLEVHTLINGFLITGLAALIGSAYFFSPDKSGGWINNAAGPIGIAALALFCVLAFLVWNQQLRANREPVSWLWMVSWIGLIVVAMTAATTDRILVGEEPGATAPWIAFRILMFGSVVVSAVGMSLAGWFADWKHRLAGSQADLARTSMPANKSAQALPILLAAAIAFAFAFRGGVANQIWFAGYETAILGVVLVTVFTGLFLRRGWLFAVAIVPVAVGSWFYCNIRPPRIVFDQPFPELFAFVIAMSVVAIGWLGYCIYRSRVHDEKLSTSFTIMPSIVMLAGSIVTLLPCFAEFAESIRIDQPGIVRPLAIVSFGMVFVLIVVNWWNDNRRLHITSRYLWSLGIVLVGCSLVFDGTATGVAGMLGIGMLTTVAGLFWNQRVAYRRFANRLNVRLPLRSPGLSYEARVERVLKIFAAVLTLIIMPFALMSMLNIEDRALRYVTVFVPFAFALGWGLLSNERVWRWLQIVSLCLVTIGVVFLAWADLGLRDTNHELQLGVRTLLAMAGLMLVYGNLVTRWVQHRDTWLKSLREMSVATCALAFLSLLAVVGLEWQHFVPDQGSGIGVPAALAVTVVVLGMIAGLITIAVQPKHDPFSFSLKMRQAYVYAAQAIAVLLVGHVYLAMPWLFQFGIMDYWPYLAMIVSFGGVGIARLLEQRKLTVLAEPLFNTAAVLPVLIAAGVFAVSSEAEPSLVLFTAGLIYLMISYVNGSVVAGAASVLFGNAALWIFYGDFTSFSIIEHPQLFLIPPAISVLLAGQIYKDRLSRHGLAMLRYICVVVIYVSSTSEIFISGIGEKMWPPMILAVLSLLGIGLGILLQVRAFLYLGSLFLLTSMIAMVANAHRAIGHVWPWWAFGIGLGVAILVMFGLFEKRRNDLRAIAGKLNEWDL